MANVSLINGHIDNANKCVCCGEDIPEGRQVCFQCEAKADKEHRQTVWTMRENIAPCKNCSERHYKCHSECESYKLYREELKRVNEIRQKDSEQERASFDRRYKAKHRENKSKIFKSPKR